MDRPALLPLTALQQRMWHLCTAYPGKSSPIVVLSWQLRGPLDVAAFAGAVAQVVDRHPSLRTRFPVRDGRPWQEVGPVGRFEVECLVSDDPLPLVTELTVALLDLEQGPLVRSRLIKVDDEVHVWCFAAHHLLADGASAKLIEAEVVALYQGKELPPASVAVHTHDPGGLRWWVDRLAGVPPLELAAARPAVKEASSAQVDHGLDGDLTTALERLARAERSTLFMVLFTGYQMLLALRSGQRDFCVGTPVDGRTEVDQEEAVGLFANMLALRCDLSGAATFRELLRRTRAVTIDALARQDVPFGRIVEALGLPHDRSRTQVFQTIFSMHTVGGGRTELPGVTVEMFASASPQVLHDLVLDLWHGPDGVWLTFRYDKALFAAGEVMELARRFEAVLRAAVADPDVPLSGLEVW